MPWRVEHHYTTVDSPLGELFLASREGALRVLSMWNPGERPAPPATWHEDPGDDVLQATIAELGEYFEGTRTAFDVPLAPAGTPFQQSVWRALREIPYGSTTTYGALARQLGYDLTASRAVGLANGRNPIGIIIPCHRVIGADGSLTGYAGGLPRKRWLLALEARVRDPIAELPLFAAM